MSVALSFLTPPPGLDPHRDFSLEPVAESEDLFALRAAEDPGLRLYAVDPRSVVTDYAPTLTDEQADALGLEDAEDALVLVIARHAADGVSVNLKAPVVINRRTGSAAQVILDDQDYPVREPLR